MGRCGRRDQLTGGPGMVYDSKARLWSCYLCYAMPVLFPQPVVAQQLQIEAAILEERVENPCQDGLFDILKGKSVNPTFTKRHRAGPNWIPHAARIGQ